MSLFLFFVFMFLGGCSGGSGDMSKTPTESPTPTSPSPGTQPGMGPTPMMMSMVNAGFDQTVKLGDTVLLSGSSTATENPQYLWKFVSMPTGSGVTLTDPTTLTPSFRPDLAGLYIVALILNAGLSDQVTIDVQANLITLHFNGRFGTDSVITGSFTYEATQGPIGTNVRGLTPNVLYRLTAWEFAVESGSAADVLPSTIYKSTQPDNTSEFCEGICLASSTKVLQLLFRNQSNLVLTLNFVMQDPTPFINPPSALAEWGGIVRSTYRVPCPVCVPVAVIEKGTLSL